MILSDKERMTIQAILPQSGAFNLLKILTDLRDMIGFTEEEVALMDGKEVEGGFQWKIGLVLPKEFDVGPKALQIITDSLEKLNKEEKLTMETFPLYKRLVVEGE